jgi:hypothetical protein
VKAELDRNMLLTLAKGTYPHMSECDELVKIGAMRWTGNQHNLDWAWERSYLEKLTDEELLAIYLKYQR